MQPTHVVVDTHDGYTWAKDAEGKPFAEATAGQFAVARNSEMKPGHRTYRVFRLIPADDTASSKGRTIMKNSKARTGTEFQNEIDAGDAYAAYVRSLGGHILPSDHEGLARQMFCAGYLAAKAGR